MHDRIAYFLEARLCGTRSCEGSLDVEIGAAQGGMRHSQANIVRIVEVGNSGGEVWSGRREGSLRAIA